MSDNAVYNIYHLYFVPWSMLNALPDILVWVDAADGRM